MKEALLLILPMLLPILAGFLLLVIKPLKERKVHSLYVVVTLGINFLLVMLLVSLGDIQLEVLELVQGVPILLKLDDLGRFFLVLMSVMWLLAGIFAQEYMKHEKNEARYFAFYLIVSGVLVGLGLAGNLVTIYMFYELMTFSTLPLVLHTQKHEAVKAGMKYLLYSVCGASLSLGGIVIFYFVAPTTTFTAGGVLGSSASSMALVAAFMVIIGFGSKAGMFPLHGWLPTAHPAAPAPASSVLSGIITKAGVLAMMRTIFYIVGAEVIRGTWVQYTWMILALITIFMGSMMAYKEQVMKKRFAYSTVSQVSYILFGLSTLNVVGVTGALLHMVFHSIVKDILFLVAGAIIYKTNKTRVEELRGIGKQMPLVMICYTIASITLIGLPPTSAFVSKEFLAHGALETGIAVLNWLGPVILLISALLTAGYLLPISIKAFLPGEEFNLGKAGGKKEVNLWMSMPLVVLTIPAVLLGMFPMELIHFVERLAHSLL